jgi:hypothetical protein
MLSLLQKMGSPTLFEGCETGTLAEMVISDQGSVMGFADTWNGRADAQWENEEVLMGGRCAKMKIRKICYENVMSAGENGDAWVG